MKKISNFKRKMYMLRLFLMPQSKRGKWLKKKHIFYKCGDNLRWAPINIPSEPYLVSIGNNVRIASLVDFITHDIIDGMFATDPEVEKKIKDRKFSFHMGKIVIGDYVMIGSNSIILYDVEIGSHCIIAAGSVVTKNVPSGAIVGGNPARVIGNYYDLANRRNGNSKPTNNDSIDDIIKGYWTHEDLLCDR